MRGREEEWLAPRVCRSSTGLVVKRRAARREGEMMRRCAGHPGVVPLLDELAGGTLLLPPFEDSLMSLILRGMIVPVDLRGAVEWMHRRGVVHRDIKPSNVLYRVGPGGWRFALADFGCATEVSEDMDPDVGTLQYRCPEMLRGERDYGKACDWWAYGCTLWHAADCRIPFAGSSPEEVLASIASTPCPHARAYQIMCRHE